VWKSQWGGGSRSGTSPAGDPPADAPHELVSIPGMHGDRRFDRELSASRDGRSSSRWRWPPPITDRLRRVASPLGRQVQALMLAAPTSVDGISKGCEAPTSCKHPLNAFSPSAMSNRVHSANQGSYRRELSRPCSAPYKINSLPLTGGILSPELSRHRNGNASTVRRRRKGWRRHQLTDPQGSQGGGPSQEIRNSESISNIDQTL